MRHPHPILNLGSLTGELNYIRTPRTGAEGLCRNVMSSVPDLSSLTIEDERAITTPPPDVVADGTEASNTPAPISWDNDVLEATFERHFAVCLASKSLDGREVPVMVVRPKPRDRHTPTSGATDLPDDIRLDPTLHTSKEMPLVVLCPNRFSTAEDAAYIRLYEHLRRMPVRRLQMQVPQHLVDDFLTIWASRKWSAAEHLISFDVTFGQSEVEPSTWAGYLLGESEASRLQTFKFKLFAGITGNSLATVLPATLQEFSLVQNVSSCDDLTPLLATLEALRNLKSLHLQGVLPTHTEPSTQSSDVQRRAVTLPSLTKLSLASASETKCTHFLARLQLPRVQSIHLKNIGTSDAPRLVDFGSALSARLADAQDAPHFDRFRYGESKDTTTLYAWSSADGESEDLEAVPRRALHIEFVHPYVNPKRVNHLNTAPVENAKQSKTGVAWAKALVSRGNKQGSVSRVKLTRESSILHRTTPLLTYIPSYNVREEFSSDYKQTSRGRSAGVPRLEETRRVPRAPTRLHRQPPSAWPGHGAARQFPPRLRALRGSARDMAR